MVASDTCRFVVLKGERGGVKSRLLHSHAKQAVRQPEVMGYCRGLENYQCSAPIFLIDRAIASFASSIL